MPGRSTEHGWNQSVEKGALAFLCLAWLARLIRTHGAIVTLRDRRVAALKRYAESSATPRDTVGTVGDRLYSIGAKGKLHGLAGLKRGGIQPRPSASRPHAHALVVPAHGSDIGRAFEVRLHRRDATALIAPHVQPGEALAGRGIGFKLGYVSPKLIALREGHPERTCGVGLGPGGLSRKRLTVGPLPVLR